MWKARARWTVTYAASWDLGGSRVTGCLGGDGSAEDGDDGYELHDGGLCDV